MKSLVKFQTLGRGVCKIILNRANKANAINLELGRAIQETLARFEEDREHHVAILTGAGLNFCAGYDLNDIIELHTGKLNQQALEQLLWPISARLSESKVTIAAIEGHATGFGLELALKCDFRVAERDARMGFLNRRFGVPIMNGGTVLLPKLVGHARALDLIATGRAQLAPEALQHGLLNHVADIGCNVGKALNVARCVAKFPKEALQHDLNILRDQNQSRLEELMRREREQALKFLANRQDEPFEFAVKFLKGQICRHGNTDLGTTVGPETDVTL